MVLMLRAVGVPARNVTGFIGGTFNRFGKYYAVRQGDAHSWVEVFVDGVGWQTYDPTPPAEAEPQIATAGLGAFVRDVLEAVSQRWDRHAVVPRPSSGPPLVGRFVRLAKLQCFSARVTVYNLTMHAPGMFRMLL